MLYESILALGLILVFIGVLGIRGRQENITSHSHVTINDAREVTVSIGGRTLHQSVKGGEFQLLPEVDDRDWTPLILVGKTRERSTNVITPNFESYEVGDVEVGDVYPIPIPPTFDGNHKWLEDARSEDERLSEAVAMRLKDDSRVTHVWLSGCAYAQATDKGGPYIYSTHEDGKWVVHNVTPSIKKQIKKTWRKIK